MATRGTSDENKTVNVVLTTSNPNMTNERLLEFQSGSVPGLIVIDRCRLPVSNEKDKTTTDYLCVAGKLSITGDSNQLQSELITAGKMWRMFVNGAPEPNKEMDDLSDLHLASMSVPGDLVRAAWEICTQGKN